jgi:hypothetical protein
LGVPKVWLYLFVMDLLEKVYKNWTLSPPTTNN